MISVLFNEFYSEVLSQTDTKYRSNIMYYGLEHLRCTFNEKNLNYIDLKTSKI